MHENSNSKGVFYPRSHFNYCASNYQNLIGEFRAFDIYIANIR